MTNRNTPSNQYLSIRKRHLATLAEIARDGTVEVGQFKAALQWAISRLDGMPEHWVASPDETSPPRFTPEHLRFIRNEMNASLSCGATDPLFQSVYDRAKEMLRSPEEPTGRETSARTAIEGDLVPDHWWRVHRELASGEQS